MPTDQTEQVGAGIALALLEARRAREQGDRPLVEAHSLGFRTFDQVSVQVGAGAQAEGAAVLPVGFGRFGHSQDGTASGTLLATANRGGAATNSPPPAKGWWS